MAQTPDVKPDGQLGSRRMTQCVKRISPCFEVNVLRELVRRIRECLVKVLAEQSQRRGIMDKVAHCKDISWRVSQALDCVSALTIHDECRRIGFLYTYDEAAKEGARDLCLFRMRIIDGQLLHICGAFE